MSSFPSLPRSNLLILIPYQIERQKTKIEHLKEIKEEVIPEVIYSYILINIFFLHLVFVNIYIYIYYIYICTYYKIFLSCFYIPI